MYISVSNSIFFVTHFQVSGSFMINYSIYPAWKLPAGTSWAEQNSRLPWRIESLGSRCPLHSSCCLWQLGGVPNLGTGSSRHLWFCVGCSRCVSFFLIGSAPVSSGGFRTWHHPQTVSVQAPPVLLRCAATGWCHEGHSCQISCELKYRGVLKSWGIPKSPWVSMLKWPTFGWFGGCSGATPLWKLPYVKRC